MNALQEIIEPPLHAYEPVEERLVDLIPAIDSLSDLCGARLTPDNASPVLNSLLHDFDIMRAKIVEMRDQCEAVSPHNPAHIYLTAEDWQLLPDDYTDDEEPIYTEAETVAEKLNATFNRAVDHGFGERETRHMMLDVMEEHLAVGAGDTEPRYVLGKLLIEHFGPDVCAASGWDAWRNFAGPGHKADRERWRKEQASGSA